MRQQHRKLFPVFIFISLLTFTIELRAQQLLDRRINLQVNRQRLEDVLEIISNQGNFFFSYNSNIVRRDSLVTVNGRNITVRSALGIIFPTGYEYQESGNYIIIRRAPLQITIVTEQSQTHDNYYVVKGYVRDDQTGERIRDATVYEKQRLSATMTNEQGYFRLKLKSRFRTAALTVSKEYYQDTTVQIQAGYNQQLTITLSPALIPGANVIVGPAGLPAPDSIYVAVPQPDSTTMLYLYKKMDSIRVQRTAMGRFLLSSRLRLQSINLDKFFTVRPVQVSLTPGLSTNGKLNAQVINNFSFNVFGGYSGGVNGFELGGLFNIDKKDVQYLQVGGLFNIVGGSMKGVQVGGLNNTVLDSAGGVQVGGINNFVKNNYRGVQVGGVYNHTGKNMSGVQVGGVFNFAGQTASGVQVSGVFNYAKRLRGLQIGLINIADTSNGYSIGLINIVLKGYHKLAFYGNEVLPFNAAFKTGNHKLYSILMGGVKTGTTNQLFAFGYGIGTDISFNRTLGMNIELGSQYLYMGSWDYVNLLNRASVNLQVKFGKYISVFAGPAFTVFYSDQDKSFPNYKYPVPASSYKTYDMGTNLTGWIGWTAGVHIF